MDINKSNIKLVIGLGNPIGKYKNTYHNVGFQCIDFLEKHLPPTKLKLVKSKEFMNKSGIFVKDKMNEMKINPENVLIIQDDADIAIGKYKFSHGRGSAGHKGILSIIDYLGTKNFWRLRIGVRRKDDERKSEEFVLSKIDHDHKEKLVKIFSEISQDLKRIEK